MLDSFLHSGYKFNKYENLQKFRFSLLNSILVISAFFTFLNYFASIFGAINLDHGYENAMLAYAIINILSLFILRVSQKNYLHVANITIISALALFYYALFITANNELRLIWFFILNFVGFVLMGKRYGVILTMLILPSIFIIHSIHPLNLSKLAMFTFFNSFIILMSIAFFFLQKVENDALEFKVLNDKLKEKVTKEVKQRLMQEQMLLQQCRLASMGEMIDSIAHQWRQPLMNVNAILMNMDRQIELHGENVNSTKKIQEYLENKMDDVINLTTHMSQTIEDFRTLFKADKEKVQFEIVESIEYAKEIFKSSLKEINFTMDIPDRCMFYGHKNELTQVIIILLGNAIEALKNRQKEESSIKIKVENNDETITIFIEDTAGGIDEEYIDLIFDPYFTTKEATGGTGLGLYVAKIIIEQNMSGRLKVVNTKKGANFILTLQK